MDRKEWTLGPDDAEKRLDRVLRRLLANNTQGAIASALRKGLVKVNGKKADAACLTKQGDILSVAAFLLPASAERSEAQESAAKKPKAALPFPVIFENEHLLFIDKPAGISVHDGPDSVAQVFCDRTNDSLSFVSAPLHRLDKGTSGLLAVSKSAEGARWFCKKIKDREIKKYYWGIVLGRLAAKEEWTDELEINGAKKAARTIATPIKSGAYNGKEISLVLFQIFTGRKRQIREQSAMRGHPILGDKAYGGGVIGGRTGDGGPEKSAGFYLRSMRMEFPDNDLGLPPAIDASEPQDFLAFFK
ncbi:MAG: RluA family pseudouridine synthase [Treponema sp.]|nr:RluA family pseudouridine synthase [Treponema sp.]